jgi:MFS family permease
MEAALMPNNRRHAMTVMFGFAQLYAWATTYYLPAALTQLVAAEIGRSYLVVVGGFSWALLLGGLLAPKFGGWIDHEGGRRPLCVGSLLMGIGLIVLSQTHGMLAVWYLGWTIIGLGMALGLFNATFASVGRLYGQDAKGIIIRITLISGFATLLWPLTTYLVSTVGWQTMVLIYALPHLALWAPLFYFTIPATVPAHFEEHAPAQQVVAAKVKIVFYLLAAYAIIRAIVGTTISVSILDMFAGIGLTTHKAAIIAGLIGPAMIAGRIIEITFGKKIDPVHSSIFWAAVLPFSILILVLFGPHAATLFSIAYGMSNGVLSITMGVLPMILFGTKGYAQLIGKLGLPVLIAQAATPLVLAPMIQKWPAINIFILSGILGMAALICLVWMSSHAKNVDK